MSSLLSLFILEEAGATMYMWQHLHYHHQYSPTTEAEFIVRCWVKVFHCFW